MPALFIVISSEVMTAKFKSHGGSRSNNHYSYNAAGRELLILSLWNPTMPVAEVTGTTPIFYGLAPVLIGSLEAARFVSVLQRKRQVDKSG